MNNSVLKKQSMNKTIIFCITNKILLSFELSSNSQSLSLIVNSDLHNLASEPFYKSNIEHNDGRKQQNEGLGRTWKAGRWEDTSSSLRIAKTTSGE